MPRRNRHGLELTFNKANGQWRKRIAGKDHYFGTGHGVTDRASYRAALDSYKVFVAGQAEAEAIKKCGQPSQQVVEAGGWIAWGKAIAKWKESHAAGYQTTATGTVGALLVEFLKHQKQRMERRQYIERLIDKGVEIKEGSRQNISFTRWAAYKANVQALQPVISGMSWDGTEQTATKVAEAFRNHFEKQMQDGDISPNTFNERVKTIRAFYSWLYGNYKLQNMPRKKSLFANYQYRTTAKSIPMEDLKRIWAEANDRMKAYVCLGLNCGYYAIDISELRRADIVNGEIVKPRHKTQVLTRYKLWSVTATLIAKTQNGSGNGRLYVDEKTGKPLIRITDSGKGMTNIIGAAFTCICRRLAMCYSFSHLRDTAATAVNEKFGLAATDLFLGHVHAGQAVRYVDTAAQQNPLDSVTIYLEGYFGLSL